MMKKKAGSGLGAAKGLLREAGVRGQVNSPTSKMWIIRIVSTTATKTGEICSPTISGGDDTNNDIRHFQ
jgi:hypothetical protein